ncbi:MAG TPA: tetratricopeptide repeat protein [Kofleriaceae bacterium]|nr:tetratricopeptide repeat protein [Kofleriaceae bacterium]
MRGHTAGFGSVDILVKTLREEFPELDPDRLKAAIERAIARAATASLDTESYKVVDLTLARVEATEESAERAAILRELSESLEQRRDADRALVVRLAAFAEVPIVDDLDPLLRLAQVTERWAELPLEKMLALIDITEDASVRRLTEIASAWQQLGRGYYAADCLERVLAVAPADPHANEALELFYRANGEWSVLVDLLGRRANHVASDRERAELFREMAVIYERQLGDEGGALDAYREADRLARDRHDVVEAIARLTVKTGDTESETLEVLERLAKVEQDPKARAQALCRAAEIAKLHDWDKAQALFERARADDPDLVPAIDGLSILLRDRGELSASISLLVTGAERPALGAERSRWLTDAADFCVAIGDTDWAKQLYRDARATDPANHRAGVALVELCWDTGALVELAPILDELCRSTDDPGRLRTYLLQRSKVAAELGDRTGARMALTRAVDLDPYDLDSRRDLARMLFEAEQWEKARPLLEGLLEHEEVLPPGEASELHYRIARCAHELGDHATADKQAAITLALAPHHRGALLMRAELDAADPFALAANQLALANIAPPEEKAARFSALGDRYVELGDRATAREMYREALQHRPGDHLLLTKFLNLVAEDGDWSYSLDLVQRLIDTEQDPRVRARYRHLAAQISRDELDDRERAVALLALAVEDDPLAFGPADELEALLDRAEDQDELARYFYRRLEHMRHDEGRPNERLRLWDKLGDLCIQLGRHEDAVVAFEVALTLAPDDPERRQRLADLYMGSPAHDHDAIAQHQAVLRGNKRRSESYKALRALYGRTLQPEKARAVGDAIAALAGTAEPRLAERIDSLFGEPTGEAGRPGREAHARALGNEDWLALSRIGVDVQLSALFALVAPAFAAERARMRPPQGLPAREADVPAPIRDVLDRVAKAFGISCPPVYIDRDVLAACTVAMRVRNGVLVPVVVIGRPALDRQIEPHELAFVLARQLADLRNDRVARLLCPRAGELAQIIELATAVTGASGTHAARWLSTSLHPVELDQVAALGTRLRERGVHPLTAATTWLAATERAADRIAFVVVGDLGSCVRLIEREPAAPGQDGNRTLELIWASITEEVLAVRARVEGWSNATPAPPRTTQAMPVVEPPAAAKAAVAAKAHAAGKPPARAATSVRAATAAPAEAGAGAESPPAAPKVPALPGPKPTRGG